MCPNTFSAAALVADSGQHSEAVSSDSEYGSVHSISSSSSTCAPEPESFDASYDMQGFELGQGTSGAVCAAVCRRSGRKLAVKSYAKEDMRENQLTCMRSELAVHRRLSHPGIVRCEAIFESEDNVKLVMERCQGGELFDRVIKQGSLAEQEVAKVAVQLLQALIYLHDRNILHRDVKLENIMYESQGENKIKLIDFGFATTLAQGQKLKQRCGTLEYAAPEMLAGKPYDHTVDVWSAGVVIYTMLTGRLLIVNGQMRYSRTFHTLGEEAQGFVRYLLKVDPRKRCSARDALNHPWLQNLVPELERKAPPAPQSAKKQTKPGADLFLKCVTWGALAVCCSGDLTSSRKAAPAEAAVKE